MAYTASSRGAGNASSAWDAAAVIPHDSTNFPEGVAVGLYVGGSGNVSVVTAANNTVIFYNVPAGKDLMICCKRVNNTGTTATLIDAYFHS